MSLLGNGNAPAKNDSKATEPAVATAGKSAGANYQAKQKQLNYEAALLLEGALKRGKVELTADEQAALARLTRVPGSGSTGGGFGQPVIFKIFGATPKVGQKVSAIKIFEETGKGFNDMKGHIKKWEDQGTKVTYEPKTREYVIEELGSLPAAPEASKEA